MLKSVRLQIIALLLATYASATAAVPVIPGAAGFGIDTPAGRGGKILRVTNLNDKGTGSLRACAIASGPRVCVFEVSGTIALSGNLVISNPNITIAGQTAPAPGIMLRGASLIIAASDVLVQHLAVRPGDDPNGPAPNTRDALKINRNSKNVVVDHCSFSWALDENLEAYREWDNVTISNTIISHPLDRSLHDKGGHAYGAFVHATQSSSRIAFVRNLFAHSAARNPRTSAAQFVFVNNVIYNPGSAALMLYNTDGIATANSIVGNVFIKGPDTSSSLLPIRLIGPDGGDGTNEILAGTKIYISDNIGSGISLDESSLFQNKTFFGLDDLIVKSIPTWPAGLNPLSAEGGATLDRVLKSVGSRPGQRDSVDAAVIADVKSRSGGIINCVAADGSSACKKNAGGWPSLAKNVRPLNLPSDPSGDSDGDGYTNLEEWLHDFSADVEGGSNDQDAAPPNPPKLLQD